MIAYVEDSITIENMDTEILNEMGVLYIVNKILPQKIQLSEQDMNYLFSEIFMGEADIEYAGYGGKGCDFSIIIKGK